MVDLNNENFTCDSCQRRIKDLIEDGVLVAESEEDAMANPPICKLFCHKCYKKTLALR